MWTVSRLRYGQQRSWWPQLVRTTIGWNTTLITASNRRRKRNVFCEYQRTTIQQHTNKCLIIDIKASSYEDVCFEKAARASRKRPVHGLSSAPTWNNLFIRFKNNCVSKTRQSLTILADTRLRRVARCRWSRTLLFPRVFVRASSNCTIALTST